MYRISIMSTLQKKRLLKPIRKPRRVSSVFGLPLRFSFFLFPELLTFIILMVVIYSIHKGVDFNIPTKNNMPHL